MPSYHGITGDRHLRTLGTTSLLGTVEPLARTSASPAAFTRRARALVSRHARAGMAHSGGVLRCTLMLLCGVLAVFAVLASSSRASAQQIRCSVTNAVGPSFGAYDTLSTTPTDSAGYITLRCDRVGPSDTVVIELGRGRGHSFTPRRMKRRNQELEYNMYLDAARTLIWGDGSRGTSHYQLRPTDGRTESIPIYARIPPRQTVAPGSYSDQVMLTLHY